MRAKGVLGMGLVGWKGKWEGKRGRTVPILLPTAKSNFLKAGSLSTFSSVGSWTMVPVASLPMGAGKDLSG